jgi:ankyrin repeat protein
MTVSWAAHGGHEAVVRLLIERDDVDADLKNNSGRTPLWWAAIGKYEAVVKPLKLKLDLVSPPDLQ